MAKVKQDVSPQKFAKRAFVMSYVFIGLFGGAIALGILFQFWYGLIGAGASVFVFYDQNSKQMHMQAEKIYLEAGKVKWIDNVLYINDRGDVCISLDRITNHVDLNAEAKTIKDLAKKDPAFLRIKASLLGDARQLKESFPEYRSSNTEVNKSITQLEKVDENKLALTLGFDDPNSFKAKYFLVRNVIPLGKQYIFECTKKPKPKGSKKWLKKNKAAAEVPEDTNPAFNTEAVSELKDLVEEVEQNDGSGDVDASDSIDAQEGPDDVEDGLDQLPDDDEFDGDNDDSGDDEKGYDLLPGDPEEKQNEDDDDNVVTDDSLSSKSNGNDETDDEEEEDEEESGVKEIEKEKNVEENEPPPESDWVSITSSVIDRLTGNPVLSLLNAAKVITKVTILKLAGKVVKEDMSARADKVRSNIKTAVKSKVYHMFKTDDIIDVLDKHGIYTMENLKNCDKMAIAEALGFSNDEMYEFVKYCDGMVKDREIKYWKDLTPGEYKEFTLVKMVEVQVQMPGLYISLVTYAESKEITTSDNILARSYTQVMPNESEIVAKTTRRFDQSVYVMPDEFDKSLNFIPGGEAYYKHWPVLVPLAYATFVCKGWIGGASIPVQKLIATNYEVQREFDDYKNQISHENVMIRAMTGYINHLRSNIAIYPERIKSMESDLKSVQTEAERGQQARLHIMYMQNGGLMQPGVIEGMYGKGAQPPAATAPAKKKFNKKALFCIITSVVSLVVIIAIAAAGV